MVSRRASTVLYWFAWVINLDRTKEDKKALNSQKPIITDFSN